MFISLIELNRGNDKCVEKYADLLKIIH